MNPESEDSLSERVSLAQRSLRLLGVMAKRFRKVPKKGTTVCMGKMPLEKNHRDSVGPVRINNHSYVWR